MKRSLLTLLALAGLAAGLTPVESTAQARLTAGQRLQALKQANDKLLETQAASLLKLDDLLKEAQQMRVFSRRT